MPAACLIRPLRWPRAPTLERPVRPNACPVVRAAGSGRTHGSVGAPANPGEPIAVVAGAHRFGHHGGLSLLPDENQPLPAVGRSRTATNAGLVYKPTGDRPRVRPAQFIVDQLEHPQLLVVGPPAAVRPRCAARAGRRSWRLLAGVVLGGQSATRGRLSCSSLGHTDRNTRARLPQRPLTLFRWMSSDKAQGARPPDCGLSAR